MNKNLLYITGILEGIYWFISLTKEKQEAVADEIREIKEGNIEAFKGLQERAEARIAARNIGGYHGT